MQGILCPQPWQGPCHTFILSTSTKYIFKKKTNTQPSILRGPQESKKLALEGSGQGPGSVEGTRRLLWLHPAKSISYALTRGGAYSTLGIWSGAECSTSAPEVTCWGEKMMGGPFRNVLHGYQWSCVTGVPRDAGNAMATAKCLTGSSLAGQEAPAQHPGVSVVQAVIQEPPSRFLRVAWTRKEEVGINKVLVAQHGVGRETTAFFFKYCRAK